MSETSLLLGSEENESISIENTVDNIEGNVKAKVFIAACAVLSSFVFGPILAFLFVFKIKNTEFSKLFVKVNIVLLSVSTALYFISGMRHFEFYFFGVIGSLFMSKLPKFIKDRVYITGDGVKMTNWKFFWGSFFVTLTHGPDPRLLFALFFIENSGKRYMFMTGFFLAAPLAIIMMLMFSSLVLETQQRFGALNQ